MATSGAELYLKLVGEQVKVVETLDRVVKRLEKLEGGVEKANKKVKTLGDRVAAGFKKMGKGAQEFSKKVVKLGVAMGAAGLLGAIYKSIAAASSFETKMAEVSTLLGASAEPKMKKFNKVVRDLAKTTSATANDLASGLYQVISAGTKGTEEAAGAMRLLDAANKMSVAGVSDVRSSVDVLTTALNAWGASADESAKFSDQMFKAIELGKLTLPDLSAGLGVVASAAAGAGIEFGEVNAALAAMTAAGVPPARAMTSLNAIIRVASKGSKEMDAVFGTAASNILRDRGLLGVMEKLRDVTDGDTIALQKLGIEQEAVTGLAVLAGTGIDKFRDSLAKMEGAAGATELAYEKMSKTFSFQSKKFKNVVNDVFISIGEKILPTLIKKMEEIGKWVEDHEEDIKDFIKGAIESIIEFGEFIIDNGATIAKAFVAIWLTSLGPIGTVAAAIGVIVEGLRQLMEWMGPGGKGEAMIAGLQALGIIGGPARDVRTEKGFEWDEDEELGGISGAELFGFKKPPKLKKKFKLPGKLKRALGYLGGGGVSGMGAFGFGFGQLGTMAGVGTEAIGMQALRELEERRRAGGFKGAEALESYRDMRAAWKQMAYEKWVKPMEEPTFWEKVATGFAEAIGKRLEGVIMDMLGAITKPVGQIGNLFGMALGGATVEDVRGQAEQMVAFWEALAENIGPVLDYLIDEGIPMIIDAFVEHIPDIIDAITEAIPEIINAFISKIPDIALALAEAVGRAIGNLVFAPFKLFGLFHEGGIVKAASQISRSAMAIGGALRAHSGMYVGGGLSSDEIPIIAQAGEGIIRKEIVAAMGGERAINAINRGQAPSGGDTHIHMHAEHYFAESSAEVVDGLVAALLRKGHGAVHAATAGKDLPGFESRR